MSFEDLIQKVHQAEQALEAGERRVDEVIRPHDDVGRQIVDGATSCVPEVGRCRTGQDGLDTHVLVSQFLVKRLA